MNKIALTTLAAGALLLTACKDKTSTPPPSSTAGQKINDAAKDAAHDTADAMRGAKDKVVSATKSALDDLSSRIDKLRARASDVPEASRDAYNSSLHDLDEQLVTARARFDEMKAAASDKWDSMKTDVQSAVDRLGDSLKTTADKYGLR